VSVKSLAARKRLLESVSLDRLRLSPEVLHLLRKLRNRYELYLLTSGKPRFQNAKIDHLNIRKLFADILIVGDSSSQGKAAELKALAARREFTTENILVVGNRLDNEIAAAKLLGMPAAWIRRGEGSEQTPGAGAPQPDFSFDHVVQLTSLLGDF
jgi:FMN phosphatase YigB (HAD superfamily)